MAKFKEGDVVLQKVDPEKNKLIITGKLINGKNVLIEATGTDGIKYFRDFEIELYEEKKTLFGFKK